jgi:hypothetical protein
VYWGINYRLAGLPFIQSWYVINTKGPAIRCWHSGPLFLRMLHHVLRQRDQCNGIQWLEILFCRVCVSYEQVQLKHLVLELRQTRDDVFPQHVGQRQKSLLWQRSASLPKPSAGGWNALRL